MKEPFLGHERFPTPTDAILKGLGISPRVYKETNFKVGDLVVWDEDCLARDLYFTGPLRHGRGPFTITKVTTGTPQSNASNQIVVLDRNGANLGYFSSYWFRKYDATKPV